MEPTTGHVRAYVGGINYKHFKYDHVTQGARQVGSTFKPFLYTLAMQNVPVAGRASAWFAEHQSAGRGRRGRTWVSPYGRNIYFSLAWGFEGPMARLSGLSIAAGAMLAGLLYEHGLREHGLKWPNDLYIGTKKCGGILCESIPASTAPFAVIGIGINCNLSASDIPEELRGMATSLLMEGDCWIDTRHINYPFKSQNLILIFWMNRCRLTILAIFIRPFSATR